MKLIKDEAIREAYSYDATGMRGLPEGVFFPKSVEEVKEAVLYCRSKDLKVVPRGGGTGFVGGSVPLKGSVVVSLEKMRNVLDVDDKNMVVVVEPGVITAELQRTVKKFGLMYPPDPSSLESCTIGGNVATNAGGPRAVKYGVTADYVKGLEVVLGTGEIYSNMARVKKKVVGLNITPVFVGSEGTLGIVTKVLLKLVPLPETASFMLVAFKKLEDAGDAISKVMSLSFSPSALEIMDITSIRCVRKYKSIDVPEWAEAVILVEVDGFEEGVKRQVDVLKGLFAEYKAEIMESEEEKVWAARRAISPSLMSIAPTKINEDVTVPVSRLADALKGYRTVSERYGIPIVCFGHAGDGNIHVNIMTDKDDPVMWEKALKATKEVFIITVALGGVLSGEHGIGLTKRPYLGLQVPSSHLDLYRRLKAAFDPDNIMNPGKKF